MAWPRRPAARPVSERFASQRRRPAQNDDNEHARHGVSFLGNPSRHSPRRGPAARDLRSTEPTGIASSRTCDGEIWAVQSRDGCISSDPNAKNGNPGSYRRPPSTRDVVSQAICARHEPGDRSRTDGFTRRYRDGPSGTALSYRRTLFLMKLALTSAGCLAKLCSSVARAGLSRSLSPFGPLRSCAHSNWRCIGVQASSLQSWSPRCHGFTPAPQQCSGLCSMLQNGASHHR